ncbi:hypothetical protein [Mucilaginibacter myungsuensis]|uniref:Uncharacterized protein n=1 Tax=Mucilaginibacter myungsuensis TaxID=649104 RepID=A0A929KZ32_9SPHI|nr:hypothetical protein [Mucilaginibacter myungsuensis]MBE9663103.1 hypothetical protein [Mucilaginibacter myungsuensis]MDN3598738.1 hypothetical protein [Mucilaginibacter myungsuensis]
MLNAISWQQYLTAILLLCVAWYAYVGLRFYSKEIAAKLKIKAVVKSQLPPVATRSNVVMGAAKADPDAGVHPADELIFGSAEPDDIDDQTLPAGPSDELLAEAKVLVTAYSDNNDKSEFLSLFKLLIGKYEVFSDEISLPAIIRPLREYAESRLPFSVKETEWPLTF